MDRPRELSKRPAESDRRSLYLVLLLIILSFIGFLARPGFASKVPVRDGLEVKLKLRNVLTTDNVRRGDEIEFEVAEDVMISGHVVIAKGATAHGKVLDVKGAFNPRANNAEVVFQFLTVSSVDHQDLPVRPRVDRTKKGHDDEIHEKSPIPGQIARVVGADKGKEYEVYVDGSFSVEASDAMVMTAPAAAPNPAPSSAPASTLAPAAAATPAPLAGADIAAAPSSVEFGSTPDGADIVVDGNVVGNTPSILRLTPGHHSIEIRMAGYRTWSRIMVVDPESHPSVRAILIKQ